MKFIKWFFNKKVQDSLTGAIIPYWFAIYIELGLSLVAVGVLLDVIKSL